LFVTRQTLLRQSLFTTHCFPELHRTQAPPQSTSVSVPFLTVSLQAGTEHRPPLHTPLVQSVLSAQPWPSEHFGQVGPPQSTSVSGPFLARSLHVGTAHFPPLQTPLVQSVLAVQLRPSEHFGQLGPPQSTSVSASFRILSVHVPAGAVHTPLTHASPAAHTTLQAPQ
jgi:hypothetical protein